MKNPAALLFVSAITFSLITLFGSAEASLVLPDAEFEFAAPVSDPTEAAGLVATPPASFGFKNSGRVRSRDDGFFRAEFTRDKDAEVSLKGRAACVQVRIYTSRSGKSAEQAAIEASELKLALVHYLQAASSKPLLFKVSGCEEAL